MGLDVVTGLYSTIGDVPQERTKQGFLVSHCELGGVVMYLITFTYCCLFICFVFQGYWGCAIGKARQAAKTEIEKLQVWCNSVVLSQNIPSLSCYLLVPEMHQMQNWVKYFLVHLPVSQVSE